MTKRYRAGSRHSGRLLVSAIGVAVVGWGEKAAAQTTAPQQPSSSAIILPPVKVQGATTDPFKVDTSSSPKQTAPLLDQPQTITVIPQAVIEEQRAFTLQEVLRNTPGISFEAGENGFSGGSSSFMLRGFNASGNIFIDNARDSGLYARDTFNVDRVEVVKGAAADNGRGGAGGYINMVTKKPVSRSFYTGDVTVGFDSYGTEARKRMSADVNQTINENSALRLNAMVSDGGVAGRDMARSSGWGIAPALSFGAGGDFRATVQYEHLSYGDRPDFGVPGATIPGMITYAPSTFGAPRTAFYGLSSDYDNAVYNAFEARLEYDFSAALRLSNQTRWSRLDRNARFTVPFGFNGPSTVTTQTQYYNRVNDTISNLTNLSATFATGPYEHNLSAGIELTRELSFANQAPTNNPPNTNVFYPNPNRSWPVPFLITATNDISIDTVALYAFDTMKINPQWEVTGGVRLEWYNVSIGNRTTAGNPATTLDGYNNAYTNLAGRIGVVYKPAPNGSVYAAFSVSGQPPGSYLSNPDISREGQNAFPGFVAAASSITNYNYELGTKWNVFDNRLALTAALFRTVKTGVPIVGFYPGSPAATAGLKGTEQQVVQGLELSAAGGITKEWNVFGGLAVMDSRRYHSQYLDAVLQATNPADYGAYSSTNGNQLAFTPTFTANLWTTYSFPFGLTIGGGIQHVSSSYLGRPDDALRIIPNGRFGTLPGYTVVNAMLSYELTENVLVQFNANNIFNETYAAASNWNGARAALGAPQSFMLTTAFKF